MAANGKKDNNPGPEIISHWRRMANQDVFLDTTYEHIGAALALNVNAAKCAHCGDISIWINRDMAFPLRGEVPAHDDMPDDVKQTFSESSKILSASPRASAALARLALQQLCVSLGATKKSLDDQIGELVSNGLSAEIQMMLYSVRVIGNNAVHPGEIDMKTITQPRNSCSSA